MTWVLTSIFVIALVVGFASAQNPSGSAQSFAQCVANLERHDGFIPFYFDSARGRIFFEISRLNEDLLDLTSVSKGIAHGWMERQHLAGLPPRWQALRP